LSDLINLLKRYWLGVLLSLIALAILNLLFGSVCFSVILFGIPCPACGITRASKLMITGHFVESFQMHPLLILVILGFIFYPFIKKRLKNYCFFIKFYVIICLVVFIVYYIYRMKVYFPNKEPMLYQPDNIIANYILPYVK